MGPAPVLWVPQAPDPAFIGLGIGEPPTATPTDPGIGSSRVPLSISLFFHIGGDSSNTFNPAVPGLTHHPVLSSAYGLRVLFGLCPFES
jgi:hypothetical protein